MEKVLNIIEDIKLKISSNEYLELMNALKKENESNNIYELTYIKVKIDTSLDKDGDDDLEINKNFSYELKTKKIVADDDNFENIKRFIKNKNLIGFVFNKNENNKYPTILCRNCCHEKTVDLCVDNIYLCYDKYILLNCCKI